MKTFFIIALSTVAIGFILNFSIDNPVFDKPLDEIGHAIKTDNLNKAEKLYLNLLQEHKYDLDLNYGYVVNHFNMPEKTKRGKHSYNYRDDATITNYYTSLSNSNDTIESDLGFYFLGLCYLCKDDYINADQFFRSVKNTNLKYLNNSWGNAYKEKDADKAIGYFEKEIKNNGNMDGAVVNLSMLLIKKHKLKSFETLLHNDNTKAYIPISILRKYYYIKGEFGNYMAMLWNKFINSFDTFGAIGALIIALIWLIYLRFIDVFEREKWYHIAIVFALSSAFTYCSFYIYDFYNLTLGFDLNGNLLNDLFYCIFGIGLIEEFIKLIPFALFLMFSRAVNEPIDYVIYACVAAIGFSFTENIIYFQNNSYHIMHGRALASVVGHMCDSSIVAYGFIISRYKNKTPLLLTVFISLIAAAIVHGLYDFWLLNKSASSFSILTILILVWSVVIWNTIKNNSLNHSPFFDKYKKLDSALISRYLFIALSVVFIFEYLVISINYGPSAGNRLLFKSILSGTFLIIFIIGRLGQFQLKAGIWESIKLWESKRER